MSMEQPVKVATPLVAAVGVQVERPGAPGGRCGRRDRKGHRRGVSGDHVALGVFDRHGRLGREGGPTGGSGRRRS